MLTQKPKGTADFFGKEVRRWHYLEDQLRKLSDDYNIGELRTPIFEHTELFVKSSGETSDVVQKEMFTFQTKGEKSLTLKPEGTPGSVRAYVEYGWASEPQPVKIYYLTPLFRYEAPQAGRMRQFHSYGIEFFGTYSAAADAEVINVAYELFRRLGLTGVELHINSLGCPECRPVYIKMLRDYLRENLSRLCKTCNERFERNPLRILDCKEERCGAVVAAAPSVLDALDPRCRRHFEELQANITALGMSYRINPRIVRGLDYYTRTVFEFISGDIGAQSTVCGGGRYDGLIAEMGGAQAGAVGFGMGLERVLMAMDAQNRFGQEPPGAQVYVGSVGREGALRAMKLANALRMNRISAECDLMDRSVKAQLKHADKIGAGYSIVIGENEIASGAAQLKNMVSGRKADVRFDDGFDNIEEIVKAIKALG